MVDLALSLFITYWPALLIITGVGYMVHGVIQDEMFVGIFSMVVCVGLGILFFFQSPGQVWEWLSQFEFIHYLFKGKWYEVALKVGGTISVVGLIIKFLIVALRET